MPGFSLVDLEVFAAVARNRSFRRTARERGVSASALSQAVRNLEERLEVRLFNRTTRSVALTDAGERLLRRVGPALAELGEAVEEVNAARNRVAGTLRINAPEPAANHVLGPLIEPFLRRYPEIHLEIIMDASITDIVARGFDAGVRFDGDLAQDMIAVPLGPTQRYMVLGAPDYLARQGVPSEPGDLAAHSCIRHRFPGGGIFHWRFEKDGRNVTILPEGPLTFNSAALAVRCAAAGLGLARVLEGYAEEALAGGEVVEVLADWSQRIPGWFLYYPGRRHVPAALRAFVDFVRAHGR
ncbi:LysR family transcriptional regulator [Arenibaculum pallidiluteum]|uniref:LysR family transcriptional regulator n=1 Tax=Arenibaculum pallidiluteum TaxID=2812559 RepID=UPI001A963C6F|nr:LysR family transcriptional regulator [Arenibaculum pallidiluteum]